MKSAESQDSLIVSRWNRLRVDQTESTSTTTTSARNPGPSRSWVPLVSAILAAGFVLIGGGNLDLSAVEARLGLASGARIGPLGLVYGLWEPGLLFGEVFPSQIWARVHGGFPTAASVRWPGAIAAVLIGFLVVHRANKMLGQRAGVLAALVVLSSLAMIDRSVVGVGALDAWLAGQLYRWTGSLALLQNPIAARLDLIGGLAIVAALDRILTRGADRLAGLFAGLAFLAMGWPALAAVALPIVVIGKQGHTLNRRSISTALILAFAWMYWTFSVAGVEALAASLALPLTEGSAWTLPVWVLAYALPWSPLALLALSSTLRRSWPEPARDWAIGWIKVTGALILAGTLIPGLANATRVPSLIGLAIVAVVALDRVLEHWESMPKGIRRAFLGLCVAVVLPWAILATPAFGYLAAAVPYYRQVAILLVVLGLLAGFGVVISACRGSKYGALGAVLALAICFKLAHFGVIVPEWNYRVSQGPWGRAIGQWMPRTSTLYFVNPDPGRDRWPADLAFSVGRRVRRLAAPQALEFEPGKGPHFVLLHPAEFDNWPGSALPLMKVRELQDPFGSPRVLARTKGPMYPDLRDRWADR